MNRKRTLEEARDAQSLSRFDRTFCQKDSQRTGQHSNQNPRSSFSSLNNSGPKPYVKTPLIGEAQCVICGGTHWTSQYPDKHSKNAPQVQSNVKKQFGLVAFCMGADKTTKDEIDFFALFTRGSTESRLRDMRSAEKSINSTWGLNRKK